MRALVLICLFIGLSSVKSVHTLGKISIGINTSGENVGISTSFLGKKIDELRFKPINALGGYAGLRLPKKQPLEDYFMLAKFGDYDGQFVVIDTTGHIQHFSGGSFYVSADHRYVFTNWERDGGNYGFSVFDAHLNKKIYFSGEIEYKGAYYSLGNWYQNGEEYYAVAEMTDNETKLAVCFNPLIKQYQLKTRLKTKGQKLEGHCIQN